MASKAQRGRDARALLAERTLKEELTLTLAHGRDRVYSSFFVTIKRRGVKPCKPLRVATEAISTLFSAPQAPRV